jgi:hypothetical protein
LQELDKREAKAARLYAAAARELDTLPLTVLASLIREAVETYPDHPDGVAVQCRLQEMAESYAQDITNGCAALQGGLWQYAVNCFEQAARLAPHQPQLTAIVARLSRLTEVKAVGRASIDAAIQRGDMQMAMALAALLDRDVEEEETALRNMALGVDV